MNTSLYRYVISQEHIKNHNLNVINKNVGKLIFDKAIIDLKPRCNLNCWGCFNKNSSRTKDTGLNIREKLDLISQMSDFGVKTIIFAGQGEPLLDPDFWVITKNLFKLNFEIVLYTNGTVLNRECALRLREFNISIIIKRNTFNHVKQNMLFGTSQPFSELALRNTELLIDMGLNFPHLAIESYIIRPILDDLKDVLRYCRQHQLLPYLESYLRVGPPEPEDTAWVLSDAELSAFFEDLQTIDRGEFDIKTDLMPCSRIYGLPPCDKAHTILGIRHNGDVTFCIHDYRMIGNIKEKPLSELLDPGKNLKLKQLFSLGCWYSTASYTAAHG